MIPAAPAAVRNAPPLLGALRRELPDTCRVFEIGSGDGYHAALMSNEFPGVEWYPSEVPERVDYLRSCLESSSPSVASRVLEYDVNSGDRVEDSFDVIFSCNTAHIMSLAEVESMFRCVGGLLSDSGRFLLYGPFRLNGEFTSESNAAFHRRLRQRHPDMGIRSLATLDDFASEQGMLRSRLYAMPANNLLAAWCKATGATGLSPISD